MSESEYAKPRAEKAYEPKGRCCLMCGDDFVSSWPGERVCRECKTKANWRDGESWFPGGQAA